MKSPQVRTIFDEATCNATHIVSDPATGQAAVIDPVLDFDPVSCRTSTSSADKVIDYIRGEGLDLTYILETHIHADHLTAGAYLKQKLGGRQGVGAHATVVQETFGAVLNLGPDFRRDGSQFDLLLKDGDTLALGELEIGILHTPGHTPACVTYVLDGMAVIGDTLFRPDYGTARCDFPGGDAHALYHSIRKILDLPGDTVLYLNHDYPPAGGAPVWTSTVAAQRRDNIHARDGIGEDEFVALRRARDRKLKLPRLIIASVQINMRAGELPAAEDNGGRYLKMPLNVF